MTTKLYTEEKYTNPDVDTFKYVCNPYYTMESETKVNDIYIVETIVHDTDSDFDVAHVTVSQLRDVSEQTIRNAFHSSNTCEMMLVSKCVDLDDKVTLTIDNINEVVESVREKEPLIYATFADGRTIKDGDSLESVLQIFKEILDNQR